MDEDWDRVYENTPSKSVWWVDELIARTDGD
jgi:hypothetical protein